MDKKDSRKRANNHVEGEGGVARFLYTSMRLEHFQAYLESEFELRNAVEVEGPFGKVIKEGILVSKVDGRIHPIRDYIPRLVPDSNYADNFGLQWNKFKTTQLDSRNGRFFTFIRFWTNTRWVPKDLYGKTILEAGCGAGRFTEILLGSGANVVSFDFSNAVDANYANTKSPNLFIFQGDLYRLPFFKEHFDYVFCHGVLQHTPDPEKSFLTLISYLKPGGEFSVDHYEKIKRLEPWYQPKYLWRPVTTKIEPEKLLRIIQVYMPFWLPIDTVIRKVPKLGRKILSLIPIPCWNYPELHLSYHERLEWAIMDTFDALAPAYDIPKTKSDLEKWCQSAGLDEFHVFHGGNGLVANGRKSA